MPDQLKSPTCLQKFATKQSSIIHDGWEERGRTIRGSNTSPKAHVCSPRHKKESRIIRQDIFDSTESSTWPTIKKVQTQSSKSSATDFPSTHLNARNGSRLELGGLQQTDITNPHVKPIIVNKNLVGFQAEDPHARYCWLTGLHANDPARSASQQTQRVFELMIESLSQAGMGLTNVARTWFFNHRILDWYEEFNRVRSNIFQSHKVFENIVPASTGVGMPNAQGYALVADVFAVLPFESNTEHSVTIQAIPSPLQCPALDYNSSFSRAIEIQTPTHKRVMISGTASIELEGQTAHLGDIHKQIALTMKVIEEILTSRGLSWSNAHRSVAYFKHAADVRFFTEYCQTHYIPELHHISAEADICRHDLLFELELEACATIN